MDIKNQCVSGQGMVCIQGDRLLIEFRDCDLKGISIFISNLKLISESRHEVFKKRIEESQAQSQFPQEISPDVARMFWRGLDTTPVKVEKCELDKLERLLPRVGSGKVS